MSERSGARERSKQSRASSTSERCKQTTERTSEWPNTAVWILGYSGPQCSGGDGGGFDTSGIIHFLQHHMHGNCFSFSLDWINLPLVKLCSNYKNQVWSALNAVDDHLQMYHRCALHCYCCVADTVVIVVVVVFRCVLGSLYKSLSIPMSVRPSVCVSVH